jgi:hypothetical protein
MIVSTGLLENLEPVTMLEKSWNDCMSSKELRVTMVLLKGKYVSPLRAKGTIGYFVYNATIDFWSAGGFASILISKMTAASHGRRISVLSCWFARWRDLSIQDVNCHPAPGGPMDPGRPLLALLDNNSRRGLGGLFSLVNLK